MRKRINYHLFLRYCDKGPDVVIPVCGKEQLKKEISSIKNMPGFHKKNENRNDTSSFYIYHKRKAS